ncbi:MAG TPA: HAMP domain-containing sensor histidine kinase [Candidatus Didemnitutus sp.]|nr:HAMP domain-containing sensor histidine kinase [Candidatus Didemnitutus sp.]
MFDRLRESLALRLAVQYALVFALGSALLFTALYWMLAGLLEKREQVAVEHRVAELTAAYSDGGVPALSARVHNDLSPEARSLFVRLISPSNGAVFVAAPPDWIETQVQRVPFPEAGVVAERKLDVVRVPQDALRDYTVASGTLPDGWIVQVGRLTDSRAVLLAPLQRAFSFVGAGALLLSVGIGTLLAWRATRPLRLLSQTATRILEQGDRAARVTGSFDGGELATLVQQFNTLLDRNAAHVQVLRDTLDNLAHDLRTPLTRLRGSAELAMQDVGDPADARAALADCVNESDRLLHLLEALLDISAAEGGALKLQRERVDLRALVERSADLYSEVAQENQVGVFLETPAPVEIDGDPVRLGQVVNNLLDNALKYTPAGGRVTLTVRRDGPTALVTVTDNGPGIPVAERDAVFRRLYRSDASRSQRGLGLGLSLVKAIVEAHTGTVALDGAPGGGARFTVRLPAG